MTPINKTDKTVNTLTLTQTPKTKEPKVPKDPKKKTEKIIQPDQTDQTVQPDQITKSKPFKEIKIKTKNKKSFDDEVLDTSYYAWVKFKVSNCIEIALVNSHSILRIGNPTPAPKDTVTILEVIKNFENKSFKELSKDYSVFDKELKNFYITKSKPDFIEMLVVVDFYKKESLDGTL